MNAPCACTHNGIVTAEHYPWCPRNKARPWTPPPAPAPKPERYEAHLANLLDDLFGVPS